jgi:hypothetical protein
VSPVDPRHPDSSTLRDFAAGTLDPAAIERVATHLDTCPTCLEALEALADDDFVGRLRSASAGSPGTGETEVDLRIAALALRRDTRSSGPQPPAGSEWPALPGDVGPYVILREVGRGGMGVVYQARHRELGRLVALKMILAGQFASEGQRQRFRREAELAARVQHPQVVQVFEVGLHDGRPYLAVEWVDGGTLAERLGEDPWPQRDAAALVEQVALAIDAAHRQGVVHRDLKPANILLAAAPAEGAPGRLSGRIPKVADFGLARAIEAESDLTSSGAALGTPEYMPPEQAAGRRPGPAGDVYALGAILYRLLTGRPPFRGDSAVAVLEAVATKEPIEPRRLRAGLARDLDTITLKALEKEPHRRYQSARALADDLRRYLDGRPVLARPPTAAETLAKWARRRPDFALLSAALLAVTLAAFAGMTALWRDAVAARDRESVTAAEALRNAESERRARYRSGIAAIASAMELNNLETAGRLLDEAPPSLRDWEWRHFASQLDNASFVLQPAEGPVAAFALSPSEALFGYAVVGSGDVRLRVVGEAADGAILHGAAGPIRSIAFSPDGATVAAGTAAGTMRLWSARTVTPVASFDGLGHAVNEVGFSPDGRWISGVLASHVAALRRIDGGGRSSLATDGPVAVSRDSSWALTTVGNQGSCGGCRPVASSPESNDPIMPSTPWPLPRMVVAWRPAWVSPRTRS